ncbi:protease complex subunit PrcB family protein [Undibacterium baiyunense]|uniref:Protease complex subunit PrcB family protein n=1 Tax=Undibacterium baiyunense TaxID=2828731 RepID=A0A941I1A1_9BURK|nr:protease complex subunit PrcB family protein [Undibacterium baiyunense]MBR7746168.1 protease complex subunit PrcB family protein [Undibacterium baiyunense]
MSAFNFRLKAISLATTLTLTLSGCGGDGGVKQQDPAKIAPPIASNEFLNLVKDASCANFRNRLFIVDQKYVLWDKAGNCADASYAQNLYGNNVQSLLCTHADSIAGPRTSCTDTTAESLFKTMIQNLDKADLGLGSGHQVQSLNIPAPASNVIAIKGLSAPFYRGNNPQNTVIKDQASWNTFWTLANIKQDAGLLIPDFNSKMVLVNFFKTANNCSITRFLRLNSDGQKLSAHYFQEERIAIASCDPESPTASTPMHMVETPKIGLPVEFTDVSKSLVTQKTITSGFNSGIQDTRNLVIKDQATWNSIWQAHNKESNASQAQIDFSKKMLIAVFLGSRGSGCNNISDLRIWRNNGKLAVSYYETEPAPHNVCTAVITTPYYIAEIDQSNEPVEFNSVKVPVN